MGARGTRGNHPDAAHADGSRGPVEPSRTEPAPGGGRIPIPGLRNALLRLQGYKCAYTGAKLWKGTASKDHVIPLSRGGTSTTYNIMVCDRRTNCDKNGHLPGPAALRLWLEHIERHADDLRRIAAEHLLVEDPQESLQAAREAYSAASENKTLWELGGDRIILDDTTRSLVLQLLVDARCAPNTSSLSPEM